MATNSKQNEILAAKERKKKLDNELSQKQKTNITKNTGIITSVTQKNKFLPRFKNQLHQKLINLK